MLKNARTVTRDTRQYNPAARDKLMNGRPQIVARRLGVRIHD